MQWASIKILEKINFIFYTQKVIVPFNDKERSFNHASVSE